MSGFRVHSNVESKFYRPTILSYCVIQRKIDTFLEHSWTGKMCHVSTLFDRTNGIKWFWCSQHPYLAHWVELIVPKSRLSCVHCAKSSMDRTSFFSNFVCQLILCASTFFVLIQLTVWSKKKVCYVQIRATHQCEMQLGKKICEKVFSFFRFSVTIYQCHTSENIGWS